MKEYLLFIAAGAALGGVCDNIDHIPEKEIKTNCCKCYHNTEMRFLENEILENKKSEFTLLPGQWEKNKLKY
jgi:hypothetical protein